MNTYGRHTHTSDDYGETNANVDMTFLLTGIDSSNYTPRPLDFYCNPCILFFLQDKPGSLKKNDIPLGKS